MGVFPFCIHRLTPVAPAPRRLCVGFLRGAVCERDQLVAGTGPRCATGRPRWPRWPRNRGNGEEFSPWNSRKFGEVWIQFFFSILDDIGSCPSQWLKLPFFGEDWVNSPFFERKVRVRLSSADLKEPSLLYPESTFRNWVPVTEWVTSMFSCWTSSLLYQ